MIAAAAGLAAWVAYGSAYALAANARWPAKGQIVRTKVAKLHVLSEGEAGPSVLCLHGASANAREFRAFAALLSSDFRVFAMDRPGHGHSPAMAGGHKLARQAAAAAALIETQGLAPAIIVAHSLGCAAALRLVLDRPELVAGLVLIAPASHPYPGDNAWHARLAAAPLIGPAFVRLFVPLFGPLLAGGAIAKTFAPAKAPRNYPAEAATGLLFRPKTFRANAREVVATRQEFAAQYFRYNEIEQPAIIVTADRDRVASPRIHAAALARTLPHAELVTIPGAGHMPHH